MNVDHAFFDNAPCIGHGHLFFADTHPNRFLGAEHLEQAKAICAGCPHREPCLEYATERNIDDGVWGGTTGKERRRIRRAAVRVRRAETAATLAAPIVLTEPAVVDTPGGRQRLAPCGTVAAYHRHLRNGETPDTACAEANRIYKLAHAHGRIPARKGA